MPKYRNSVSRSDIEKKEKEIEALLERVLRDPIGEYNEQKEKLGQAFRTVEETTRNFGDRLKALPTSIEDTVKSNQKKILTFIKNELEEIQQAAERLYDERTATIAGYLKQFDETVQKTPAQVEEKIHLLKEDLRGLSAQEQQHSEEILKAFDIYAQNIKDLSSQVTREVAAIPATATQNFKEVINETQLRFDDLIKRQIDRMEDTHRRMAAMQEKIQLDLQNHAKMLQEGLEKQTSIVTASSERLQDSFVPIKDDEKLILSTLKEVEGQTEKELAVLKGELAVAHRDARSHKVLSVILLVITLLVASGDGVMELLRFFHH